MAAFVTWFRQMSRSHFFRYGVPFITCIVGGTFVLKEFGSVRYDFRKSKKITEREAEKIGLTMRKDTQSLEDIYEEYKKEDMDSWENIRGPRPWEDSKTVQDLQRQKKPINT